MVAKAMKFEKMMKAAGAGAFSRVEYDENDRVVLRTSDVKTADMSGTVRLYFDSKREQVLSGRRFDPMGSGLILMRPGQFYRVYTTLEIVEPLPKGVHAEVVTYDDISDILMVTTGVFREGYVGPIYFTVQPYRKIEMERMTSLGSLIFFEDGLGNSDRTKKSTKAAAPKKSSSKQSGSGSIEGGSNKDAMKGDSDASSVSSKSADNKEG